MATQESLCLDTSAVVILLRQEDGWEKVRDLLARTDLDTVLPGPVLAESIRTARRRGLSTNPQQIASALVTQGARIEPETTADLVRAAMLLEISDTHPGGINPHTGDQRTLSLGDALILAVTERLGCAVMTRDRYWDWMVDHDLLKVDVVEI